MNKLYSTVKTKSFFTSIKGLSILIALFMTTGYLFTNNVHAQELPLQVAPARQQITLNPGEKSAVNIKFYNLGKTPISGFVQVADFIVDNNQGTPRIIDQSAQILPRFSAASWITIPYKQITIAPNDLVVFQAKIEVPTNARPGGRYAAVYLETTGTLPQSANTTQQAGSAITHRLASLIYIRVAGPIAEKALISQLFSPSFYEYGPINVKSEILNRGDYHIRPKGVMSLTNMFNGIVDQSSIKGVNIFPDVSRTYKNSLGQKWMMGRYKINLAVSYGSQGKALERFIYVWVFPWRVATAVILAIIIISYLLYHFYKVTRSRQTELEKEMGKEQEEIEKLKTELKKRHE